MPGLIETIIKTRETAADIFAKSLTNIDGLSELEIKEKLVSEIKNHNEIFPGGWYNPPPSGIAVLIGKDRLQYDSLRSQIYWPKENIVFEKETVGLIYFSPIDRQTGMIGDIGFTIYRGADEKIKQHLKNIYATILKIAEHTEVGMEFSEICSFALDLYKNKFKTTKWVTVSSPNLAINLGHSIPGSFENNLDFGNNYEEVKETIKTKRVHINNEEHFKIPETCAFTIESRLEDLHNPNMPSAYFHFIVCFNKGQKTILQNYSQIFSTVGMDYMNS
jgi:hypothetical protein